MRPALSSLALTLALLAPPAHAEIRAVVVGVSDYLTLDADLKGPSNDARLMAETLIARGVDPALITVLTSDPTGLPAGTATAQPTHAEILARPRHRHRSLHQRRHRRLHLLRPRRAGPRPLGRRGRRLR
ncbi:MAG: caspase family protein [Microthrixaceae bacterium]